MKECEKHTTTPSPKFPHPFHPELKINRVHGGATPHHEVPYPKLLRSLNRQCQFDCLFVVHSRPSGMSSLSSASPAGTSPTGRKYIVYSCLRCRFLHVGVAFETELRSTFVVLDNLHGHNKVE